MEIKIKNQNFILECKKYVKKIGNIFQKMGFRMYFYPFTKKLKIRCRFKFDKVQKVIGIVSRESHVKPIKGVETQIKEWEDLMLKDL